MVDFDSLSEEKRLGIINAAFSCFGKSGYKKASIADIAAAAGIAKASIFQYFGTKEDLYVYLFELSCDEILRALPNGNDDFFDCIKRGSEAKVAVLAQYHGMFDFLSSIVKENDGKIVLKLSEEKRQQIEKGKAELFKNVNWDKFKSGVSKIEILNIVHWISDGYIESAIETKNADTMLTELSKYMDLLKTMFYKEEYLK